MKIFPLLILFGFVLICSSSSIRIQSFTFIPACKLDLDCLQGHFCNSSLICQDKCVTMKCQAGTICKQGSCRQICSDKIPCKNGYICTIGYCIDKCRYMQCKSGFSCLLGSCITNFTQCSADKNCKQGFYCSKQFKCEDKCLIKGFCKDGQKCQKGKCQKIQSNRNSSKQINCTLPRPDQKNCPNLTWIRKPDPLVCGVTKHGQYVDFPVECYACRQKNIVFYYNKTCDYVRKQAKILTCAQVSCQVGYLCKDGKCILPSEETLINCTQPRPTNDNCPIIYFIRKPDPIACGVTKTRQLVDFEVQCYACKNKDILAYYNTSCQKVKASKCTNIECEQDQKCVDGKCISTKWPVCERNVQKKQCGKERPNEQTCPQIYFFLPPINIVCGVTSKNQRISYPVQCYACKNTDVMFYYNKSCDELSLPCKNQIKYQFNTGQKCEADDDCDEGFYCQNKLCVDKCIATLCPQGDFCEKGECIKQENSQSENCTLIICNKGQTCQNGQCIEDKCKDIFCIATHKCVDGKCIPIPS